MGADPITPEETDLQSAAVADLLLSHIHLLLVGRAGIEPAVPRLKVVCLTTRLPAHVLEANP